MLEKELSAQTCGHKFFTSIQIEGLPVMEHGSSCSLLVLVMHIQKMVVVNIILVVFHSNQIIALVNFFIVVDILALALIEVLSVERLV